MTPTPIPVLLLVRELGIGGTERQLVETARFLPLDRFTPHVGCFRPSGLRRSELEQAGVPILHLQMHSFHSTSLFSASAQLVRYIRAHNIQVVHAFDAPLNIFGVPIARLAGVPAVLSSQRGHRDLTGPTTKRCLRVTDRLAHGVVVNCEAMRRYLVDDERVDPAKIRICYNAVDVAQYSRRLAASPWRGKTVIGVVCALRPEKDLGTLLRAFAGLARKDVALLVVGSGPEEGHLRALAGELALGASCHFEPATSDVATWLSYIDIFVLPSCSEALSNSLMEAMACRCCVVASRVGGNTELIEDDKNGLLFEAGNVDELTNQLAQLIPDPARRQHMANAASEKMSSQFTFTRAAATMGEIYEEILRK